MSRLSSHRKTLSWAVQKKKAEPRFFSPDEIHFVSKNSEIFPFVFDAAAMGQYLGGIDPNNSPGDTKGFVNESCAIRYDLYQFEWETIDEIRKPFLVVNPKKRVPIFNLHIHCKKVDQFM